MLQKEMQRLVSFFTHYFVTSEYKTENQKDLSNSDINDFEKHGSDCEKTGAPIFWELADDPELKPGFKKTYCYLTENWKPCDKKDARNVYVSIFDENDVCVNAFHARIRRRTEN